MTVGYTTGVFDLFHIGHLNLLRNAKGLCDKLVVGVSTDEVVLSYKNRKPIIPFEQRIEIVKAIKYVDEVVVQNNMDKVAAWEKLHFDVLFHGSDWQNSKMYNDIETQLQKLNVKVVYLPHTEGISTTSILNSI